MKRWMRWLLIVVIALLVLGQLYRPSRVNPPVDPHATLQSAVPVPADVQSILDRSCRDCHTSQTVWPWYSNFFPINWFLSSHVRDGRKALNFSVWKAMTAKKQAHRMDDVCEQVKQGDMPLKTYLPLHPAAKLSDADRRRLCEWSDQLRQQIVAANPGMR